MSWRILQCHNFIRSIEIANIYIQSFKSKLPLLPLIQKQISTKTSKMLKEFPDANIAVKNPFLSGKLFWISISITQFLLHHLMIIKCDGMESLKFKAFYNYDKPQMKWNMLNQTDVLVIHNWVPTIVTPINDCMGSRRNSTIMRKKSWW